MANWKLPWWIWGPVTIGWAVLSMVAATFFSVGVQATFGILAILSLVWGAFATCWHFRDRLGCVLMATVIGASAILAAVGIVQILEKAMAPAEAVATVDAKAQPISLTAYWKADAVVGRTLFFSIYVCGLGDAEVVSKHVVTPKGAQSNEPVTSGPNSENPECSMLHSGNIPADNAWRLYVLALVYQQHGRPETIKTTAFFFEPGQDISINQALVPSHRDDKPGDHLSDYKMHEYDFHLRQPINSMKFTLPELFDGKPVEMGFGSHNRAFLFEPLTRVIAFCAKQGNKVSSLSSELNPAHAGGHQIEFDWNDPRQTISLKVDGQNINPQPRGFADEQCKRSIRPSLKGDDLR